MRHLAQFATVLLSLVPLAAQPAASRPTNGSARLETFLDRAVKLAQPLVDAEITVGVAIGILYKDKAAVRGVGRTIKGGDKVPDGNTVYEIGSISKVFTGILLAEAVDLGLLELTDPRQKHLPEGVKVPEFDGKKIQLVHLTTHTSALPRMPNNFRPKEPKNPYADYDAKAMYECLPTLELKRAPGERWAYSNLGVGLLGHVLTRVHGKQRYEEILLRVTGPLELPDTTVTLSESMRRRLALPYTAGGSSAHNWDLDVLAGAGAIRSTANDLLRFARLNLAAKKTDGKIRKALATSHELQFKAGITERAGGQPSMGMGWILRRDVIWHNGGTGGYRTHLLIHKKQRFAVTALANTTSNKIGELTRKIERIILGHDVKPIQVNKAIQVAPATLKRYVGEYRMSPNARFTVTLKDGKLHVQLTGQPALPVYAKSKTRFFYRVVAAEISFDLDENGDVESLTLYQGGRKIPARKIK